jgi:Asp-tRNA(Asn)/Glu-tRNA(Gln) amidotransferase A subunit family amidase
MTSIYQLSASELAKKIKSKEISSTELTQTYIDRIEKYDESINAVVVRIFDKALEDAIRQIKLWRMEKIGGHFMACR